MGKFNTLGQVIGTEITGICTGTELFVSHINGIGTGPDPGIKRLLAACRRKELNFFILFRIKVICHFL